MNKLLVIIVIALLLLQTKESKAFASGYEGIILHCIDSRKFISQGSSANDIRQKLAYKVEISLQTTPEMIVEYVKWGYFPHGQSNWDNTSDSHISIRRGMKLDKNKSSSDNISIERIQKSITSEGSNWHVFVDVNRKTGEFYYISGHYDKNGKLLS
jgi:hypothetical protein